MNTIRLIENKDTQQVLDMAYKAVYERGWVNVDFDKQHFNIQVKNVLATHNNHCIGMFKDDKILVGFVVAQIDQFIWNTQKKCHIDLVHLDTDHRHPQYYQLLMDSIMAFCRVNKIKFIRTSRSSWQLPEEMRMTFLNNNKFYETDSNWDWTNEN